jgi:hypothetical protein
MSMHACESQYCMINYVPTGLIHRSAAPLLAVPKSLGLAGVDETYKRSISNHKPRRGIVQYCRDVNINVVGTSLQLDLYSVPIQIFSRSSYTGSVVICLRL